MLQTLSVSPKHFAGRTWLLLPIVNWLTESRERVFLLTGPPGSGKSAAASWLAGAGQVAAESEPTLSFVRNHVKATHFCSAGTASSDPRTMATAVAAQLSKAIPEFATALSATLSDRIQVIAQIAAENVTTVKGIEIQNLNLSHLGGLESFNRVLRDPLHQLYQSGFDQQIVLLVDALDEALPYQGDSNIVTFLATAVDLPAPVRILATTRPDPRVLKFFVNARSLDLIDDLPHDVDDIAEHSRHQLAHVPEPRQSTLVQKISEAAVGNFLYAVLVLNEIVGRDKSSQMSPLEVQDVDHLFPKGLSGLYQAFLNREIGLSDRRWLEVYKPLLGIIGVALGDGLTLSQIHQITQQHHKIDAAIRVCAQYLDGPLPEGPFRLFHKSLADFLFEDDANVHYRIDASAMHRLVSEYYIREWGGLEQGLSQLKPDMSPGSNDYYGVSYLPVHMQEANEAELLAQLLVSFSFLEAKVVFGLVFELARDFSAAIRLLGSSDCRDRELHRARLELFEEALCRDIHFVARHPTRLFQSMWNTCWWYDAPEVIAHNANDSGKFNSDGVGLHKLLEAWRDFRIQSNPGFVWLRALLPPAHPLGGNQRFVFQHHKGPVSSIACAPDGATFISGSWDGSIVEWQLDTGEVLLRKTLDDVHVNSLAWSPTGQYFAVAINIAGDYFQPPGLVSVHCATSKDHLWSVSVRGTVHSLSFSRDGSQLVGSLSTGHVCIWNTANNQDAIILSGHEGAVLHSEFSPCGTFVASSSGHIDSDNEDDFYTADFSVRMWDWQNRRQLWKVDSDDQRQFSSVAFSPLGDRLACSCDDGIVRILDSRTGDVVKCLPSHEANVDSVVWSPDGLRIASASGFDLHAAVEIRIWDSNSGRLINRMSGHSGSITQLAWLPDSRRLLSASDDFSVRLWDCERHSADPPEKTHTRDIADIAFQRDGEELASISRDGLVRRWNARSGQPIFSRWSDRHLNSVLYSNDGKFLALGASGATILVNKSANPSVRILDSGGPSLNCLAFSSDSRLLARGHGRPSEITGDGYLTVWDLEQQCDIFCCNDFSGSLLSLAFSRNSELIAGRAHRNKNIIIWDLTKKTLLTELVGHRRPVTSIAFSPNRHLFASASYQPSIRIWETCKWRCLAHIPHHGGRIAFSPDGERLASCDGDRVLIWDIRKARRPKQIDEINGTGDIDAIAAAPGFQPFVAISEGLETQIRFADSGEAFGVFPGIYQRTSPNGNTWAGANGNELFVYRLEGPLVDSWMKEYRIKQLLSRILTD